MAWFSPSEFIIRINDTGRGMDLELLDFEDPFILRSQ